MNIWKNFLIITLLIFVTCDEDKVDTNPFEQEHIEWPSLADSPWPIMHGDPQHTGRSQYAGPDLDSVFPFVEKDFILESSIVIDQDGYLYFTTSWDSSFLYKTDQNGNTVWKYFLNLPHAENLSTPTLTSTGDIYVTDRGKIYSISTAGILNWSFDEITNTTAISLDQDGNLYFISGQNNNDNSLLSLTSNGQLRWQLNVVDDFRLSYDTFAFSIDGKQFYVSGNDSLYCVSTTGEINWVFKAKGWIYTVVDNDDNVYFFDHDSVQFLSVDKNGELNWKFNLLPFEILMPNHIILPTITRNGNIFFIGLTQTMNKVFIININGELEAEFLLDEWISTHLISDKNNNIYFGTYSGNYFKISTDGEILNSIALSDNPYTDPDYCPAISAEGKIFVPIKDIVETQIIRVE